MVKNIHNDLSHQQHTAAVPICVELSGFVADCLCGIKHTLLRGGECIEGRVCINYMENYFEFI